MAKISIKIVKKCKFFIDFLRFFEILLGAATTLQALPWWISIPSPEKILRALMDIVLFQGFRPIFSINNAVLQFPSNAARIVCANLDRGKCIGYLYLYNE